MTAQVDAEELYYEMQSAAQDAGMIIDDDADDALADAAYAQAAAHNAHVCGDCGRLQTVRVAGRPCSDCQRASRAAYAAERIPELDAKIAKLEAERDDLLNYVDSEG